MKKFTKLALAASVAFSANAMAMQAMDDASLSATTGQDGISIGIGISKVEIEKLFIHDNDGLNGTKDQATGIAPNAGAIVIQGRTKDATVTNTLGTAVNLSNIGVYVGANYSDNGAYLLTSRNLADIKIDSDAGNIDDGGAFLNIAAQVSGLEIHIGEIGVTASGSSTAGSLRRGGNTSVRTATNESAYNAILSGLSINTGIMNANIQVGAAPQGAMIKLDTKMIGGLEIKNLGILDNSTAGETVGSVTVGTTPTAVTTREAGEIFIESIKIADANDKDLTINSDIRVYNNVPS